MVKMLQNKELDVAIALTEGLVAGNFSFLFISPNFFSIRHEIFILSFFFFFSYC